MLLPLLIAFLFGVYFCGWVLSFAVGLFVREFSGDITMKRLLFLTSVWPYTIIAVAIGKEVV